VHRDLKPDNIYLVRNDDEEIAKVLDFGIAKSNAHGLGASVGGGTRTGAVLGTPYYMSPEQAEGAKTLDGRADIWAMGVIAFECLLGSRPFDEETLGSLLLAICARPIPVPSQRGPVPPGFDAWFARACARDVAQRYALAREAAADLRQICDGVLSTSSGNFAPPSSAALGNQTPAERFASGNSAVVSTASGAVSGQSVPGFSSTQIDDPVGVPTKSGGGLALVFAALGLLAIGGGVFAWTHFSNGSTAAASASAASTPSAPLAPSKPAQVEPSVAPVPVPAPVVSAATPSGEPEPSAVATKPVSAGHAPPARPHAVPVAHAAAAAVHAPAAPAPAPAPAPAAPTPKPADTRVNLGI
jgi:serine/threonine-protein kinase